VERRESSPFPPNSRLDLHRHLASTRFENDRLPVGPRGNSQLPVGVPFKLVARAAMRREARGEPRKGGLKAHASRRQLYRTLQANDRRQYDSTSSRIRFRLSDHCAEETPVRTRPEDGTRYACFDGPDGGSTSTPDCDPDRPPTRNLWAVPTFWTAFPSAWTYALCVCLTRSSLGVIEADPRLRSRPLLRHPLRYRL
jgi:hypothetical protein